MKAILYLLLAIPTVVMSQEINLEKVEYRKSFIEVVGTATKEVIPDKITVSITLSEKDNESSQASLERQDQHLKKIMEHMSIPLNRLQLADATSQIIKERRRDQTVKRSKQYTLELTSANEVSTFLGKLSDANIREVAITSVNHSKMENFRKEVRVAAIKAAKEKAIYLTEAIGEQIDKAIEIREEPFNFMYSPVAQNNIAFTTEQTGDNEADPSGVDFRSFKIKFSYYIKYSLKQ